MGVDGCWCAPRSSKPVRGVKSLSGEFDSHMLPPEPRGRVPRGFLKNVDFPLDRTEGSSYNTTVRGVSRTTSYPGVAQLVARMVRVHEAVGSTPATRTNPTILVIVGFSLYFNGFSRFWMVKIFSITTIKNSKKTFYLRFYERFYERKTPASKARVFLLHYLACKSST